MSDEDGIWYWLVHELDAARWDDGWGYNDWRNPDKPLARFLHAVHLLNTSAPAGTPPGSILYWAHTYFYDNDGDDVWPTCSTDYLGRQDWNVTDGYFIELGKPFFYGATVVERAATLIHEARHVDGCSHNVPETACPSGGSCDLGWNQACAPPAWQPSEAGANQYEISYLWEFFKGAANTTAGMKHRALLLANTYLAGQFSNEPCFRIGPNGKAYQLPLAACDNTTNAVDLGDLSLVRPEEYGLAKCLEIAGSDVKSLPCASPYWGQEWFLQHVMGAGDLPVEDGRVRIVNAMTSQCLRLSIAPTWVMQPTYVRCQRVPWTTKLTVGACNDASSEFFVTPWTPVNSSPGTRLPDSWERWRVRPALRCEDLETNVSWDGDSCVDANATGDAVLRVFWCHDSPRQQLRATDWY